MIDIIYIIILSIVVMYADFRLTWHNSNSIYNGYGCIKDVLSGKARQPMAYRVLIPWICGDSKANYTAMKYVSILFALLASNVWFESLFLTTVLAMFFVASAIFDYADGYMEVGFFALSFWLLLYEPNFSHEILFILVFLASLNRETSIFIVICAFLSSGLILGLILLTSFTIGYCLPRILYGKKERYCKFNMIKENIRRIKGGIMLNEYILFFIVSTIVLVAPFVGHVYIPFEIGMYLMFFALIIPTVWAEIRVFKPVMLIIIPMVVRVGG